MSDSENKEEVVMKFTKSQVKLIIIAAAILFALFIAGKIYVNGLDSFVDNSNDKKESVSE